MARAVTQKEIIIYADQDGSEPFTNWLERIKDKASLRRIQARLLRLEQGNYGDFKTLKEGVLELRLMFGSGYRVYFGEDGDKIVVLLMGGDKKTQTQDIEQAESYWKEYRDHA